MTRPYKIFHNVYSVDIYSVTFNVRFLYDVAMGCDDGGGVGWKAAAMSSLADVGTVVGIKGAGIAPAVMSVISGVAVAVTVTAELPAGVVKGCGGVVVCGGLVGAKGTKGGVIPPITGGEPWAWGGNDGIEGGVPPGATKGAPIGYVPVVAGEVDGKLGLNGFRAGGAGVVLRFSVAMPDSRPAKRNLYINNDDD